MAAAPQSGRAAWGTLASSVGRRLIGNLANVGEHAAFRAHQRMWGGTSARSGALAAGRALWVRCGRPEGPHRAGARLKLQTPAWALSLGATAPAATSAATASGALTMWSPQRPPARGSGPGVRAMGISGGLGTMSDSRQQGERDPGDNEDEPEPSKDGGRTMSRAALKVESALSQGDTKLIKKLVESLPIEDHVYLLKDLYSKQMTAEGFERMDTNRDGFVTAKEFDEFIKALNLNKKMPPSTRQLLFVAIASGVPFIGFGFMDNSIMIVAGEAIELNIAHFGFTTMCAAALGNMVSDIFGVGLAGYIELLAKRMGIRDPLLTPYQMRLGVVRWASSLGAAVGVSIGCILGMFPLLLFEEEDDEKKGKEKDGGAAAAKA